MHTSAILAQQLIKKNNISAQLCTGWQYINFSAGDRIYLEDTLSLSLSLSRIKTGSRRQIGVLSNVNSRNQGEGQWADRCCYFLSCKAVWAPLYIT